MSKRSQAKRSGNIAKQLTFFAAGFPVNPQASPESEKEPTIIAGSGLTFCAWCLKSNPCGCWRRILAESLACRLKECNSANGLRVSLRLEVTNCSPSSWLLKTLAHRSEESACSSWPTARATTSAMTVSQAQIQRVLSGQQSERGAGACKLELTVALQMWPTPQARDYRSPDLPASGNFQRKIAQGFTIDLNSVVQLWPTPAAQDSKNATLPPSQISRDTLPGAILRDGQLDPDSPSTDGKSCALLNPRWVAQLQGFPSDWLDGIEWPL